MPGPQRIQQGVSRSLFVDTMDKMVSAWLSTEFRSLGPRTTGQLRTTTVMQVSLAEWPPPKITSTSIDVLYGQKTFLPNIRSTYLSQGELVYSFHGEFGVSSSGECLRSLNFFSSPSCKALLPS